MEEEVAEIFRDTFGGQTWANPSRVPTSPGVNECNRLFARASGCDVPPDLVSLILDRYDPARREGDRECPMTPRALDVVDRQITLFKSDDNAQAVGPQLLALRQSAVDGMRVHAADGNTHSLSLSVPLNAKRDFSCEVFATERTKSWGVASWVKRSGYCADRSCVHQYAMS